MATGHWHFPCPSDKDTLDYRRRKQSARHLCDEQPDCVFLVRAQRPARSLDVAFTPGHGWWSAGAAARVIRPADDRGSVERIFVPALVRRVRRYIFLFLVLVLATARTRACLLLALGPAGVYGRSNDDARHAPQQPARLCHTRHTRLGRRPVLCRRALSPGPQRERRRRRRLGQRHSASGAPPPGAAGDDGAVLRRCGIGLRSPRRSSEMRTISGQQLGTRYLSTRLSK